MTDVFYVLPSGFFAVLILALMVLAIEAGFRLGRRAQSRTSEVARSQVETMQTSLLGVLLLFSAFVISGGIIGYSSGLAGHRPPRATFVMVALVVMLMFMIMDLDRPRRGIIQVSPQSLLDVKAAIDGAHGAPRP